MSDRAAALLADVLGSGEALRTLLEADMPDAAPALVSGRPVVLTGMGSSRFAAVEVLPILRAAGVVAEVALASVLDPSSATAGTTLVAISSSGQTREVVAVADRWPGPVVAVTGGPASRLAALATSAVLLPGVAETAGIACHGYRATIAQLIRLVDGQDLAPLRAAADAIDELVAGHAEWVSPAADILDRADEIHVLGTGRHLGTLEQGALMLREAPRIAALPMDASDWLHVGLYTMLPGGRALLLTGSDDDEEVVSTVAGRGALTVTIGEPVRGAALTVPLPAAALRHAVVRSLVAPVAVELIAVELWSRTTAAP